MARFSGMRIVASSTLLALLWALLSVASALAGDGNGPYPR